MQLDDEQQRMRRELKSLVVDNCQTLLYIRRRRFCMAVVHDHLAVNFPNVDWVDWSEEDGQR